MWDVDDRDWSEGRGAVTCSQEYTAYSPGLGTLRVAQGVVQCEEAPRETGGPSRDI